MPTLPLVVAILAVLSYIFLLQLVLRRSAVGALRRAFVVFLVCMTVWTLGSLLARLDPSHAREWIIFAQVGNSLGLPLATFNFVRRFTGRERARWWSVVGVVGLIAALIAMMQGTIDSTAVTREGLIELTYLPTMNVLGAYWILFIGMSAGDLAIAYRQATDDVRRNRLRYPLIAIGLIFLGAMTNGLPALRRLPVDVTANLFSAILLTYAILRYRLLDVELVVRVGLSFASVVLILAASYTASLVILLLAGPNWPIVLLVLSSAGTYLLLRFVPGLQQSAQLWMDRLLFPQRYDAQALLAEMGSASQQLRPISELATLVLERLRGYLNIRYGSFLIPGAEGGKFYPIATTGDPPGVKDLTFRADHPLILYLQETQQGLEANQIPGLPQFKGMWSSEQKQLEALHCDYFQPVLRNDRPIGLFALGPKAGRKIYSLADQRLLETLSAQLAVVMENASLYEAAQRHLRELQQAYEELRELDRLKDEFVQNVSHELRTPLTFVKGYIEMLLDGVLGPQLPKEQMEALRVVQQRTDAVIHLVNDILSFQNADREHIDREPISVLKVVQTAVGAARVAAERRGLTIQLASEPGQHLVFGDERRLGQVFDNLLGNAIKFGATGKTIEVRVRSDNGWVTVEVEDHGIGIPEDKQSKIWERFYQVDGSSTRRYGGTGLGLAIVKRIVEAHGGKVGVTSQVGVGSCFSVHLPALLEEAVSTLNQEQTVSHE